MIFHHIVFISSYYVDVMVHPSEPALYQLFPEIDRPLIIKSALYIYLVPPPP